VIFYEPHRRDRDLLPHDPFKAVVGPRPIGWVSTTGPEGEVNLAPYSYFNAICDKPPMIAFSSAGVKDSLTFARSGGEFTWNLATYALREQMNTTSGTYPRGESEFAAAGLETAPGVMVGTPRVAASPAALECRVVHTLDLTDADGADTDHHLVIGQVVGVHLDEAALTEDGRFDTAGVEPILRAGYLDEYAVIREMFHMMRPS